MTKTSSCASFCIKFWEMDILWGGLWLKKKTCKWYNKPVWEIMNGGEAADISVVVQTVFFSIKLWMAKNNKKSPLPREYLSWSIKWCYIQIGWALGEISLMQNGNAFLLVKDGLKVETCWKLVVFRWGTASIGYIHSDFHMHRSKNRERGESWTCVLRIPLLILSSKLLKSCWFSYQIVKPIKWY